MQKHNQKGSIRSIIIIFVLGVFLLLAIVLAIVAYSAKEHYKNDANNLIAVAVAKAKAQESSLKNQQFAIQEQYPLNTYNGPAEYGNLVIKYPKTWSGYVDDTGSSGNPFVSYFNPGVIPSISGQNSAFALSVQVLNQTYSQVVSSFQNQTGITSSAFALPKLPKVVGVEVSGPVLANESNGTMVVLPLLTNTLEIMTYGNQYLATFNSIILANLSFSP